MMLEKKTLSCESAIFHTDMESYPSCSNEKRLILFSIIVQRCRLVPFHCLVEHEMNKTIVVP